MTKRLFLLLLSSLFLGTLSTKAVDWPDTYTFTAAPGCWFPNPSYAGDNYSRSQAIAYRIPNIIWPEKSTDPFTNFDAVYASIEQEYTIDKFVSLVTNTPNATPATYKVASGEDAIYVLMKYGAAKTSGMSANLMFCPYDKLKGATPPAGKEAVPWLRYLELGGFQLDALIHQDGRFALSVFGGATNGASGYFQSFGYLPIDSKFDIRDCSDNEVKLIFQISFSALNDTRNGVEFTRDVWGAACDGKGLSFEVQFVKASNSKYQWNTDINDVYYNNSFAGYLQRGDKNPNLRISKQTLTYGETATVSSDNTGIPVTYSASDNTAVNIQGNTIIPLKAGTVTITATQEATNWFQAESVDFTLTVNKKEVTVKPSATMAYGDTPPASTSRYTGFINGDTEAVLTALPTYSCGATSVSDVGTYTIAPNGGAEAQNYSFVYENGTLTINKRPLAVTPNDATREYGVVNSTFTFSYSGFVNGNTTAVITANPIATTAATTASPAGTYPINSSGGSAKNYSFVHQTGTLTVIKAPLTAVAENKSRAYGDNNPALTITCHGFKNSDSETSLAQIPHAVCQATQASVAGNYPITLTGGQAQNYDIELTNGTLTVNKAAVTVTALSASSVYGENPPAFSCQYSGFKNGETQTVLTSLPKMSCSATPASGVGTYSIIPSGGAAQNYSFTYQNGTLTIDKRLLTVTPDNTTRAYGSANPAFTFSYSGFANGDSPSVLTAYPTASTTANTGSSAGTYPISCSGGSAQNYNFTYQTGSLSITKAPLTIAANNAVRRQGESNPAFTLSYSGFKNNENYLVLSQLPTATCTANEESKAGFYEITLSGGYDNNYSYTLINGTLEVTAKIDIGEASSTGLRIYPNPASHTLYIESEKNINRIAVYNMSGSVMTQPLYSDNNLDVSALPAGAYVLRAFTDEEVKRIIAGRFLRSRGNNVRRAP